MNSYTLNKGDDCLEEFKAAYENRYTWYTNFKGYQGKCEFTDGSSLYEGSFTVDKKLDVNIFDINNLTVNNYINSQLVDVTIHRVRRPFSKVHDKNTFKAGNHDINGLEIIVGGRCSGDRYRIKENIITMVHRNIHGKVININTESIINTGCGYISRSYTSQIIDPLTNKTQALLKKYEDIWLPYGETGLWYLQSRSIQMELDDQKTAKHLYTFDNITILDN